MNLLDQFSDIIYGSTIVKMIFSNKRKKSQEISKVTVKPVFLKGEEYFQVEYTYANKVTHENISPSQLPGKCVQLTEDLFRQINIMTTDADIQVLASKADKPRITRKSASRCVSSTQHNKSKNYIIRDGEPCDFLIRLGVMDKSGKVIQKHYSKFRQINRFLEITDDVFEHLPQDRTIKIIDFGCGKSYLTFALYYYLKIQKNKDVDIIGLDLKKDVIDFCNKVAEDLHYDQLQFLNGDIVDYTDDHADMVVTLHACDTATDYALINAVNWKSKVILSVPCCQHELFSQIDNPLHKPMFRHGIIKDKFTELLTDGLRGLKLESMGYNVAMIEFTSLEHTSKNIMIKAVKNPKTPAAKKEKAQKEYEALRDYYHVSPTIDQMK